MLGKIVWLIIIVLIIMILLPVLLTVDLSRLKREEKIILKVFNYQQERVVNMELNDYLHGVVAAEMPAIYHLEALKAQAVAARTYAIKQLPKFGGSGYDDYSGVDITTDSRVHQAWLSEEELKERWGFLGYFYYWSRINRAVEETSGEIIIYNDKPIDAVYHANSGGRTEDSSLVWGTALPYLKSIESPFDSESEKNYSQIKYFSSSEIIRALKLNNTAGLVELMVSKRSGSGRVMEVLAGGKQFSGREIRERLGLPSTNFEVKQDGDIFRFSILGKGHGVGMSQDGANALAKRGHNYREILEYYYPGVKITTIECIK
ncbi:MAG TPA: stage II sporulation protein D [Halanaerobiales bacterium]|nr:stage II sporulation protein D [Halanaerobiales bacterium]